MGGSAALKRALHWSTVLSSGASGSSQIPLIRASIRAAVSMAVCETKPSTANIGPVPSSIWMRPSSLTLISWALPSVSKQAMSPPSNRLACCSMIPFEQ
jgi:hypothetical protein